MDEWIEQAAPGDTILDLASGTGSFNLQGLRCTVVQVDEDTNAFRQARPLPPGPFYRTFAKADQLPFPIASFDIIVCNHGLEHLERLDPALHEIARVLKPTGRLYISIPNGYGLCDFIYRAIFEGGGHVNRFRRSQLVELVEKSCGVRLTCWHKLYSSFIYLHRLAQMLQNPSPDIPPRLARAARLPNGFVPALQRVLYRGTRMTDRLFGSALAVYGWAFYFERTADPKAPKQDPAFLNVCLKCGAGHPAAQVEQHAPSRYQCPNCGADNPWMAPFRGTI